MVGKASIYKMDRCLWYIQFIAFIRNNDGLCERTRPLDQDISVASCTLCYSRPCAKAPNAAIPFPLMGIRTRPLPLSYKKCLDRETGKPTMSQWPTDYKPREHLLCINHTARDLMFPHAKHLQASGFQ